MRDTEKVVEKLIYCYTIVMMIRTREKVKTQREKNKKDIQNFYDTIDTRIKGIHTRRISVFQGKLYLN